MGRYLWQAVLMALVILLCQIGESRRIISVRHGIAFPVQKEENAVPVYLYRLCLWLVCHDTLKRLFYVLTHGNITHTAFRLWRFDIVPVSLLDNSWWSTWITSCSKSISCLVSPHSSEIRSPVFNSIMIAS